MYALTGCPSFNLGKPLSTNEENKLRNANTVAKVTEGRSLSWNMQGPEFKLQYYSSHTAKEWPSQEETVQAVPPPGSRLSHPHPPGIPSLGSGPHTYPELQGARIKPFPDAEARPFSISWLSLSAEGSGHVFCCLLTKTAEH